MNRFESLPPCESAEFIAKHAKHVKINDEGLENMCMQMLLSTKYNKLEIPDTGTEDIRPSKDHPQAVDWVFVADSLNFCFWSYTGAQKWTVNGHTGYFALEAALHRAIIEGIDITNPEYYSQITETQLRHIMRGDNEVEIPLFDKRLEILHQVGSILLEKYHGTFEMCVKEAKKSAVKLVKIVIDNFPCFRDESTYKNMQVSFYKRAQILVADIWNFFNGKGWGDFTDIDRLTMFADYRVPQVLLYYKALTYSEQLMKKLKKDQLLPNGSEEEIEIRGCSIHAIELLKKKIEEKIKRNNLNIEVPNSSVIDYYLWCYRRQNAFEMERIPFHKTLSIFY